MVLALGNFHSSPKLAKLLPNLEKGTIQALFPIDILDSLLGERLFGYLDATPAMSLVPRAMENSQTCLVAWTYPKRLGCNIKDEGIWMR